MLHCMRIGNRLVIGLTIAFACFGAAAAGPPLYRFEVVAAYPHDPGAYTQGLLWSQGHLYESTGKRGRSTLRRVRLEDGEVVQQTRLADRYFGEGLAKIGDRLIQLTWKAGLGFVYDATTFERQATFEYTGQGWGLVHDGKRLIMSNGTAELRFLDPRSLEETGRMAVTVAGRPVEQLNELEMVRGELWANVYPSNLIARINPDSGRVVGVIDASGLRRRLPAGRKVDVLNGIAYDPDNDRVFVTGKYWPRLFEVRAVKKQ